MNILLAAQESAGRLALKALAESEHRVVAVLNSPAEGRAIAQLAERLGVPVWPAERVKDPDFAQSIHDEQVDLLLNVHSLHIIHRRVLQTPRIGCFNLHPGPLPHYAGLSAPSWAIYSGEARYGVTVHWMAERIDAGPIAYQSTFPIEERDTGLTLSLKCVREGIPLLLSLVSAASRGGHQIPRIEQDLSRRRYCRKEVPNNGWIDWSQPAEQIARFVRACDYGPFASPWGMPRTLLGDRELEVLKAVAVDDPADSAPGTIVATGDDGFSVAAGLGSLRVQRLRVNGQTLKCPKGLEPGSQLVAGLSSA